MIPDMALTYLGFVAERHQVWERRQAGQPGPWSEWPILRTRKFTNVFRVLDHGSQFLLRELLNTAPTEADALARATLYRFTNRGEIWARSLKELGRYPLLEDMTPDLGDLWAGWRDAGLRVFSGAYVIMPEPGCTGIDKTRSVVALAHRVTTATAGTFPGLGLEQRVNLLREQAGMGPFMAMQVSTDYGYSPFGTDTENDFVVCGPGARRGAKAIAPSWRIERTVEWAYRAVSMLHDEDVPLIRTPSGAERLPSYMDVQNTLCEFSKYVRFMNGPQLAQPYQAAHPTPEPPVLPAHW